MRTWDDYRKTMRAEDPIFALARDGDVAGLSALDLTPERLAGRNARGHSALMLAAYNGQHQVVRYLLDRGAEIESPDPGGSTVLMGAAFKGDVAMTELLIARGADPHARNLKNQTALEFALAFGQDQVAEVLRAQLNVHEGAK